MISGFVELVRNHQVSGWACDRSRPDLHLEICVYQGDRLLASTVASKFRADLAAAGVGAGDHAFVLHFPDPLADEALPEITVRVRIAEGSTDTTELPRLPPRPETRALNVRGKIVPENFQDDTEYPVFVLGAPRSGTSAVAMALGAATRYGGCNEGHVLDFLAPLSNALTAFYKFKAPDVGNLERNTLIMRVPREFFENSFREMFAKLTQHFFPDRYWCDKTPTVEMIAAAPMLRQIWANAKFIFMKRRGLENVLSRERKFPGVPFEFQCSEWSKHMQVWLDVRGQLPGRTLELDQQVLAREPRRAAEAISGLLELSPEEAEKLQRVVGGIKPERTGASVSELADESTMRWDAAKWGMFDRICGPMMDAYGYGRGSQYYQAAAADRACVRI